MMLRYISILVLAITICSICLAQKERSYVREGNILFYEDKFPDAEASYKKALEKNQKMDEGIFNLGDALYRQERWEDAADQFKTIAETSNDKNHQSYGYHNLGNSLLRDQKVEESIEAYKNALRINPNDLETKYNLAYAQSLLKEQKEQEEGKERRLTREEAERLLEALKNEEKKVQEKLEKKKVRPRNSNTDKDW